MALLDWIVWENDTKTQGVALKQVGKDEFWVSGDMPGQPMMPAVLMIEAGAQLACYLVSRRAATPGIGLLLGIDRAAFRSKVAPGDQLYILCHLITPGKYKYVCELQGITNDQVVFDAQIVGVYAPEKMPMKEV